MKTVNTQLRWPAALRDQITAAASRNRRSMNAEILSRLEASLDLDGKAARDRTAAMLADDVDTGGAHGSAATFRAHMDLIEAQEGVSVNVAAFRAECEGPEGYMRRMETNLRSGVAA